MMLGLGPDTSLCDFNQYLFCKVVSSLAIQLLQIRHNKKENLEMNHPYQPLSMRRHTLHTILAIPEDQEFIQISK